MKIVSALAFVAACRLAAATDAAPIERMNGTFALAGKTAAVEATLRLARTGPRSARFDLVETSGGTTLRTYDTDMTKRMHAIVIDDGFSTFQHLHPTLGPDGHFTFDLRVPKPGRYEIYADTVPHGFGQQVFRFAVSFGAAPLPVRARPGPSSAFSSTVTSGPYAVTLDRLALHAGTDTTLRVRITRQGKPARDLRAYLGGAAHAVFINASSLDYLHVHPTTGAEQGAMDEMPGMGELPPDAAVASTMTLHVAAPQRGTYELWLQFRGSGGLHVAPFVLQAR